MRRRVTFTSEEIAKALVVDAARRVGTEGDAKLTVVNEWNVEDGFVSLTMHLCDSDDDMRETIAELEARRNGN
jgi:hypothetical protein